MAARRIMIVDDVSQVRADLRTLLSLEEGFEIVGEASNGLEALSQAVALQPDVILMDLEMPLMNGYAAARIIKQQLPACRLVALTVHNYPQARQLARQSGMDAFIVKGESLATMILEIQKGAGNELKE
jgi:two-component system, NarL family, nitrate/nitrite response regulator NarL